MKYEVVAVDFDGTICENAFPDIGKPKKNIIKYVKRLAKEGSKIILFTCREDGEKRKLLSEAVEFCEKHDIPIYAVNENPDNIYPALYKTPVGRKMYADLYIDDKAINPKELSYSKVIITYLLLTLIGVIGFYIAKESADIKRGYEAVGGEVCLLGTPVIYFMLKQMLSDIVEMFK